MGDHNQLLFLQQNLPEIEGAVLEIGSKDHGNSQPFRDLFSNSTYVGVDLEEGKGVDKVMDFSAGVGDIEKSSIDMVITCSMLEHTPQPWIVAQNITEVVKPNGVLYVSAPWSWIFHGYPDDYFRFSFSGIKSLFPEFDFYLEAYATEVPNEIILITDEKLYNLDRSLMIRSPQLSNNQIHQRLYMPLMNVLMMGRKKN